MTWTRRTFVRTASLAVAGGIFVPRYERWFRPLVPPVSECWIALYGPNGKEIVRKPIPIVGNSERISVTFQTFPYAETIDHMRVIKGHAVLKGRQGFSLVMPGQTSVKVPMRAVHVLPGDVVRAEL
jgi:hypothetical protein